MFLAGLLGLGLFASAEAGWFTHGELDRPTEMTGSAGVDTGLTRYAPDRPAAPRLKGTTLDGASFDLATLRGKVVVINTWGSWCSPCRAEADDLARVARETASGPVRFVGIDTRDNSAAAQAFVRSFDITYPSVVDTDGQVLLAFRRVLPVNAVPATLILDRDGRVAARVIGRVDHSTLRGLVDDVVAEQQALAVAPAAGEQR
ncbi:TlpA family protein disulfide reductase [Kribbella catacumbae]|uniref:TlpA disulfide reductase family protein n=1 Tax=Kribbella sancticallisti TaxID=460087 RepID=A0ABN2EEL8_9ACTN|nr:TlpA disulfide reductase family protein [Kribbella catacumbae]